MLSYQEFYAGLTLPNWAPPAWVFGVAWSIIYPLFIAATVYAVYLVTKKRMPNAVLWALGINWVANLLFTPIQLGLRPLWPASLDILLVLGSLAFIQWRVWRKSEVVFWLLVPYLLWGTFATALQLTITATNPAQVSGTFRDVTPQRMTYFGNEATGDLNGDGKPDTAFIVTSQPGGSGTFFYVIVALRTATGYTGTNAVLLGDRIAPQTTEIRGGELIVNYADRRPDEPFTAQPSVGKSMYLKVLNGVLTVVSAPVTGGTACSMIAKLCPDGSYVSRTGPNCEFAPCPGQ
ncbi:MAG TPA: TspO/MBR family protein [Candidatus Paceibacterota bacterium]|nr:TspO/MBR family protein [Candidatus Paceibacterota bacterium]